MSAPSPSPATGTAVRALARPELRVAGLSATLLAAGVWLTVAAGDHHLAFGPGQRWAIAIALLGFFATERLVFRIEYRRESISFSLAEVPMAFALAFVSPLAAIAVRVIGSLVAHLLGRRPTPIKLAFNASLFAAEVAVAASLLHLLATPSGGGGRIVGALVVAIACASLFGGLMVTVAVTCFEGGFRRRLAGEFRTGWMVYVLGAVTGAMSIAPVLLDWHLVLLPVVPVLGLWRLMASRGVLAQRYRDLEDLHSFTGKIGHSFELDRVLGDACAEIQRLLRADSAALQSFDRTSGQVVSSHVVGEFAHLPVGAHDPRWGLALQRTGLRTVTVRDETLGAWLAASGRDEALVAVIGDEQGTLGVLVLADRTGAVDRFTDDDRQRLAPLVAQLAVALRKISLHLEVEREATHDRLTGLPSRAPLETALAQTLHGRTASSVFMLDIDGFKEINDTLGHHTGDAVLQEFARRVADATAGRGLLARFAGDEFAVVAQGCDRSDAAVLAGDILDRLRHPFAVGELTVAVACSVGSATSPADGTDGTDLLRRADLAMYEAKSRSSGFEAFRPEMDVNSADRLAMLAELRIALDADEIEVHFQPKIDLSRNMVIGAEALVRWRHPRHGLLAAERFIGLAERTDLIHRLSEIVLSQSLAAASLWRSRGLDLGVAVNYSARSLFDELLADRVAHQLDVHGVPAELLTIEVTESSVMSDVARATTVLERLRALGVKISVDDYGTGYSSLAYLRRLPVTELKIDRTFVTNLLIEPDDEIIVRSTIDLARNLGLQVVAEGIESAPVAARLHQLGCHLGQGYGFSRPLALPRFNAWLAVADQHPALLHATP